MIDPTLVTGNITPALIMAGIVVAVAVLALVGLIVWSIWLRIMNRIWDRLQRRRDKLDYQRRVEEYREREMLDRHYRR